jgi:CubicO group peptidase (beta-lactamase class C family)
MEGLADRIRAAAAESTFSGVVSVRDPGGPVFEHAFGLADRAHSLPCRTDTMFGIASGTKGFTAVAVRSLIEDGLLAFDTPARSVLGSDLPLIDDAVTVEHLLAHRSGIGDYVDEDVTPTPPLRVPVQQLNSVEAYLPALDGFASKFSPGERFSYSNSGYAVLAIIAQRVAGIPFSELLGARVFDPAGMSDTGFPRSDDLPGRAAVGYLEDGRTNVFELPVTGSGDGGAYSTVADMHAFWTALLAGRLLPTGAVTELTRPRSEVPREKRRYGLGFWLHETGPGVVLEGCDYGVSFRSGLDPDTGRTFTVVSNTMHGAWPLARLVEHEVFGQ